MTKEEKEKLIEELQKQIEFILDMKQDMDSADFTLEEGVLITGNEAKEFIRLLKKENY